MKKIALTVIVIVLIIVAAGYVMRGPAKQFLRSAVSIFGSSQKQCATNTTKPLTSPITDIDKISYITPGKAVFDSRFTYLSIKDKQRIPVYAPASSTLIRIFYKKRLDEPASTKPDYDMVFTVDCHTTYRLNHISDPNSDIVALTPITEPMQIGSSGIIDLTEAKITPKQHFTIEAGQQIGTTTGTSEAQNWDFSVYINNAAVCPYEQYAEPIRAQWLALLGDKNGIIPNTKCDISPASP